MCIMLSLYHSGQATNEVISKVPKTTVGEMKAAVDSASKSFETWSETSVLSRQQILFAYQGLIKGNTVRKLFMFLLKEKWSHFQCHELRYVH